MSSLPHSRADGGLRRVSSLDGLRGLAAAVVVADHVLLVVPAFDSFARDPGTVGWWLYRTPLRAVWAGPEAVLIFFALSGYVLTLLVQRRAADRGWSAGYVVQRLVRLYVPVWAALVLAMVLAQAVPRSVAGLSYWMGIHAGPSTRAVVEDATLLGGTSTLDTPLWSLQWEVWYSLLLPLIWLVVRRLPVRGHGGVWILGLVLGSQVAVSGRFVSAMASAHLPGSSVLLGLAHYLPVFGIGMVLALDRDRLGPLARRFDARGARPWRWWVALAVLLVLLVSPTYVTGSWAGAIGAIVTGSASSLAVVGLLFGALEWPAFVALLSSRGFQWLGARSFSLYLVHEPVIVTWAIVVRADSWWWLLVSLPAVAAAVAVAHVFYRWVESPAVSLSQRARTVGEDAARRVMGSAGDAALEP